MSWKWKEKVFCLQLPNKFGVQLNVCVELEVQLLWTSISSPDTLLCFELMYLIIYWTFLLRYHVGTSKYTCSKLNSSYSLRKLLVLLLPIFMNIIIHPSRDSDLESFLTDPLPPYTTTSHCWLYFLNVSWIFSLLSNPIAIKNFRPPSILTHTGHSSLTEVHHLFFFPAWSIFSKELVWYPAENHSMLSTDWKMTFDHLSIT